MMLPRRHRRTEPRRLQRGFTMIEAVIVIVITGIIAAMVAIFIQAPVQSYLDSRDRADLVNEAGTAIRRMRIDLRLALPNSIRSYESGGFQYLELLLTKTGGRYQSVDDGLGLAGSLSFTDASNTSFSYIGPVLSGAQAINPGDAIVLFNLGDGFQPADAYEGGNRAYVASVAGASITLVANPYPATVDNSSGTSSVSPLDNSYHRFQVVTTPVTYRCANGASGAAAGTLVRYWDYQIAATQPASVAALALQDANRPLVVPKNALLTADVASCGFDYLVQANRRSALVGLHLSLAKQAGNGGTVSLFDQVHVDNTP